MTTPAAPWALIELERLREDGDLTNCALHRLAEKAAKEIGVEPQKVVSSMLKYLAFVRKNDNAQK